MSPLAVLTNKLSDVRHMLHVAGSLHFEKLYRDTVDKKEIDKIVQDCDKEAFDAWVKKHSDIEYLSIRELRVVAHAKKIPYYSRMDKTTLIKEIKNANACKDSTTSGGHAPDDAACQS